MSRRGIQGDERGQDFVSTHGQRLREETSHVPNAANVLDSELKAANPILKPVSQDFDILGLMVRLAKPTATSLSQ